MYGLIFSFKSADTFWLQKYHQHPNDVQHWDTDFDEPDVRIIC